MVSIKANMKYPYKTKSARKSQVGLVFSPRVAYSLTQSHRGPKTKPLRGNIPKNGVSVNGLFGH